MRSTPQKGKPIGAGATAGRTKKHTHTLSVGQVADALVLTVAAEMRKHSRLLARQLNVDHHNTLALIVKYTSPDRRNDQLRNSIAMLSVTELDLNKATPDLDQAYESAERSFDNIALIRIEQATDDRNGGHHG
jgi:hypothetical protein